MTAIHSSVGRAFACVAEGASVAARRKVGIAGMEGSDGRRFQRRDSRGTEVGARTGDSAACGDLAAAAAVGVWTVVMVAMAVWEATVAVADVTVVEGWWVGSGELGRVASAALLLPPSEPRCARFSYQVLIRGEAGSALPRL